MAHSEGQFAGRLAVVMGAAGEGNMAQTIARRLSSEGDDGATDRRSLSRQDSADDAIASALSRAL